jgi:hypothetical protein
MTAGEAALGASPHSTGHLFEHADVCTILPKQAEIPAVSARDFTIYTVVRVHRLLTFSLSA